MISEHSSLSMYRLKTTPQSAQRAHFAPHRADTSSTEHDVHDEMIVATWR